MGTEDEPGKELEHGGFVALPVYRTESGEEIPRTWHNFAIGKIPLDELDNEELSRMQVRDKHGTFVGRKPQVVPRALAQAHARELLDRNNAIFRELVMPATQAFRDVLWDPNASHADKMKAAQYLHERFMGKVPDKVELQAEVKPWERVSQVAIVTSDEPSVIEE